MSVIKIVGRGYFSHTFLQLLAEEGFWVNVRHVCNQTRKRDGDYYGHSVITGSDKRET